MNDTIILMAIIMACIAGFFKPILYIYYLAALPVLWNIPYFSAAEVGLKVFRLGSITLYDLDVVFMLFCLWAVFLSLRFCIAKRITFKDYFLNPISLSILLLFLWELLFAYLSYQKGFLLQNILRILSKEALLFIAVFLPVVAVIPFDRRRFYNFTILLGLALTAIAFYKFTISGDIEYTSSGTVRTLLGNNVVIFMLPICYLLFYSDLHHDNKMVSWAIIVLIALGINFTGHRSGWISLLAVVVIYFASRGFNKVDFAWVPLLSMAVVLTLTTFVIPKMTLVEDKSIAGDMIIRIQDTLDLNNHTTQERLSKWSQSLSILRENPLVGLGRFPVYTDSLDPNSNLEMFSDFDRSPHNLFAEVVSHEGIAGLLVMTLFFGVMFKQLKQFKPHDGRYARFIFAYFIAFIVFSLFNTSFSAASGRLYFSIVLGLLNAEIIRIKTAQGETPDWAFQFA